jgi:wobble nucleotide-excising tRNase
VEYLVRGDSRTWKNGEVCDDKIRVFNRDYVLANVERIDGPVPIYILGEENAQLAEQIAKDEKEIVSRSAALSTGEDALIRLEKAKGKIFTDVASTISQNISGEATRGYRKPQAESDFATLSDRISLTDDEIDRHKSTITQRELPKLELLSLLTASAAAINKVVREAGVLLKKEVSSVVIERLKANPDISRWVEEGLAIRHNHESPRCEFCDQEIPAERFKSLTDHFNEADQQLKSDVEAKISIVNSIMETIQGLSPREASSLYEEFQEAYGEAAGRLIAERDAMVLRLQTLNSDIEGKKSKTTEVVTLDVEIDFAELKDALATVNALVSKHNDKTVAFDSEKDVARKALKSNYLSKIAAEVDRAETEIASQKASNKEINDGDESVESDVSIAELRRRVGQNRAVISSAHRACDELNDKLSRFLGRDEIVFEVAEDGYVMKRHGEIANDPSEGEKTAIAFVYFIVQLKDREFDLSKGTVVIDDPVSSLDSNSLFQAFAFLKESVMDAKQVFILTHNYDLMRQVRQWLRQMSNKKTQTERSYYMIKNRIVNGHREAYLAPMDKLLMEFDSEYQYLFSLLRDYKDDDSLGTAYAFPNIGRKFLEMFLASKYPNGENLYKKMTRVSYDEMEKTAILRFVHTHSHADSMEGMAGFDETIASGGQQVIASLLSMIEQVDPVHYKALVETHESARTAA